mmetsp:Transcript_7243/g.45321  ORF Transcript_7243/g.45321 Transcript_7243/m.45321 type:complete len:207 (+) Transcript_7243:711-1331(+)
MRQGSTTRNSRQRRWTIRMMRKRLGQRGKPKPKEKGPKSILQHKNCLPSAAHTQPGRTGGLHMDREGAGGDQFQHPTTPMDPVHILPAQDTCHNSNPHSTSNGMHRHPRPCHLHNRKDQDILHIHTSNQRRMLMQRTTSVCGLGVHQQACPCLALRRALHLPANSNSISPSFLIGMFHPLRRQRIGQGRGQCARALRTNWCTVTTL